jgi:hypothetical protein
MTTLKIHNIRSAPEASKRIIRRISKAYGMIPGLHGVLAGAGILDAYQQLHELFVNSSFNEEELTVVWQSINVEHACVITVYQPHRCCNDESRRNDY